MLKMFDEYKKKKVHLIIQDDKSKGEAKRKPNIPSEKAYPESISSGKKTKDHFCSKKRANLQVVRPLLGCSWFFFPRVLIALFKS